MACAKDRYAATYVVAPELGPPDCQVADFTDIQAAIAALPPAGGKIFVKAGTYPIQKTIQIQVSNVQIQGREVFGFWSAALAAAWVVGIP